MDDRDREKRAAAEAAVAEIEAGMVVGLGTGSTVAFAIEALAARCRAGLTIRAVATSRRTEAIARQSGIEVVDFSMLAAVDLCIDGVDEIDPAFRAIKGAGGAMLREKIVAQAAARMIAIAGSSKAVDRLGAAMLPVEALPFALGFVGGRIEALGGQPMLRRGVAGIAVTDQGNQIFDCVFENIEAPEILASRLSQIPGIIGHGLFIDEIDAVYIGRGGDVEKRTRDRG
ncbi:MAG: rpiA [Sphingomonadales bacterium]|nr:rpiA [Sphingomonadales bacterium]